MRLMDQFTSYKLFFNEWKNTVVNSVSLEQLDFIKISANGCHDIILSIIIDDKI